MARSSALTTTDPSGRGTAPALGRRLSVVAALGATALATLSMGAPAVAGPPGGDPSRFTATALPTEPVIVADEAKAASRTTTQDGLVPVLVKLTVQPVATYDGHLKGFPATSAAKTGKKFDPKSTASQRYRSLVAQRQAGFERAAKAAAPSGKVTHRYDYAFGGVAMLVRPADVAALSRLPGVAAVLPDQPEQLQTDATPAFVGAGALWSRLGGQASAGQGTVVGVLDTGIWPEHPSFSDPDPSGKAYAAPPPPLSGTRACEFSGGSNPGPARACNNKLIGADRFMATYDALVGLLPTEFTSARDDNGHGSHTASTAAGNRNVAATILGLPRGTVSGIAPRAHVMAYKVCGDQGCYPSDSVAAVQKAITDGVDVINFSISGGSNPYGDAVELAFLDAYSAGVFVAASAGNSGPGPDTVDHRGPWVTTVGATTSNRHFMSTLQLAGDGATLSLTGSSVTPGVPSATPVVLATAVGSNATCTTPIAAGAATGKVVVCQRGPGRILKSKVVADGGGVGMILYNTSRLNMFTDNHWVPTIHLENDSGASLTAFLAAHPGATAAWANPTPQAVPGDEVTAFSSRGGPGQTLGVSKPDVTAPGLQVLAAATPAPATSAGGPPGQLFQSIAGTSMASPHVAGGGALLAAVHPEWTPGQIKSALMTTTTTALTNNDGVSATTAFDRGSGRIRLNQAGDPGLTFDETATDYAALAGSLYQANYPSLYVPAMPGRITVERTVRNERSTATKWTLAVSTPDDLKVSVPSTITVPAGGSTTFSIAVDGATLADGAVRHAQLTMSAKPGYKVVFPITIKRGQATLPLTKSCTPTTLAVGAVTACTITASNPTFEPAPVVLTDVVPTRLDVVDSSLVGGTVAGNTVSFVGPLAASQPPNVTIAPGPSPAGGYLPLELFGVAPVGGMSDESIVNVTTPSFTFAGQSWDTIGVTSNGYAVVGGGTGADITFINTALPNAARPNNILAPFWTDLDPAKGGQLRVGSLTDGVDTWIVLEWQNVQEFSTTRTNSFQIWIGTNGDANPATDVSFTYDTLQGNGDGGFLTVGAENRFGNRGQATYVDGVGTLPTAGTELVVGSSAGVPSTKTITFDATATRTGAWTNCAELTSPAFLGVASSCVAGTVTR